MDAQVVCFHRVKGNRVTLYRVIDPRGVTLSWCLLWQDQEREVVSQEYWPDKGGFSAFRAYKGTVAYLQS